MFAVKFYPNVKGLPSFAQQNFDFVVTELGYVFPYDQDTCLWSIYNNDYVTNPDTYSAGSACVKADVSASASNSSNALDKESSSSNINYENLQNLIEANMERTYNTFKK